MSVTDKLMKVGNDQKHLKEKSYKTAEKLNIRIETHQKYTQPKVEFYDWILDQIEWSGDETVFDIGCGSGLYASHVSKRCDQYFACDLSLGMLQDGAGKSHRCVNLDAMEIPLADNSADIVLANHMIYHIPNQEKGVAEFRRILKEGGRMIAATNSNESMQELKDIRSKAMNAIFPDFPELDESMASTFNLEEGDELLKTAFEHVELRVLESWLVFPEPQPVIDYVGSSRDWWEEVFRGTISWQDYEDSLRMTLDQHFAENDEFRVSKKTGAFVCW